MPDLPLIARARAHASSVAFRAPQDGATTTYRDLLDRSSSLATTLLLLDDGSSRTHTHGGGGGDMIEARVALLVRPGASYVVAQWGAWRAGGVAVPISESATEPEWEHSLADSGACAVVADAANAGRIAPLCSRLGLRLIDVDDCDPAGGPAAEGGEERLPEVSTDRRAMILYTSGTTSRPKGVVTTHANIAAQIACLVEAWEWRKDDVIPLFLPLHHIHGIVNVAGCALWTGATIEPFDKFDMDAILDRVKAGAYTLFMAVPTIYVRLIRAIEAAADDDPGERDAMIGVFGRMRLMVSGSAALPSSVHERWTSLTGVRLLERYGMTEIGMALSTPLRGERWPGSVGVALLGVEVRLVAEDGRVVATSGGEIGEIQVRGPSVFSEYWGMPDATSESFEEEGGWFKTGDVAVVEACGYHRIMGRMSVDIIKSGGCKISALEVEAALLEHPAIAECAVIGSPDEVWGEAVCAAVVLVTTGEDGGGAEGGLGISDLRVWCKSRMSAHKVPRHLIVVRELPRNAMGKVTKPALRGLFS